MDVLLMADRYYLGVPVERMADRETLRDTALRKAAELAPFSVSEQAVEEEYALLVTEFRHRLTYDAMAAGQMVYQYEGLKEQLENLKDEAAFHVKAQMVLDDIIAQENLSVTEEELEAEGAAIARRQGLPVSAVKDFLGPGLTMVKRDLLERKAMDFIVDHAVFREDT